MRDYCNGMACGNPFIHLPQDLGSRGTETISKE